MIETRGLRKSFTSRQGREKKDRRGRARRRPRRGRGRDLRLPRPERRRQDHHAAHARHPDRAGRRHGHHRRRRPAQRPGEVRRRIGYVAQGGSTWDESTAREELVLPGPPLRHRARRRPQARAARVLEGFQLERVRRPQVQDLLGRPAPPGRHRARHHPRAEGRRCGRDRRCRDRNRRRSAAPACRAGWRCRAAAARALHRLDGVRDQVHHHLLQPHLAAAHPDRPGGDQSSATPALRIRCSVSSSTASTTWSGRRHGSARSRPGRRRAGCG